MPARRIPDRAPTPVVQLACRSLRERSSPPADDVQHEADDRENDQDMDSGGRNVKEAESRDPGDTKNDGEQKQHGGPLRMVFRTLRLWDADGSLRLGHTSNLVTPLTARSCRARIVRTIGKCFRGRVLIHSETAEALDHPFLIR
jgi:hypothetical protein